MIFSLLMNNMITLKINMIEEKSSQNFRFKNIDETRNYFIEELNKNDLMSKKHK